MRVQLTEDEFILYLFELKKYNESEMIINIIHENKALFEPEEDLEFWLKNYNKKFDRSGKFYQRIMIKNDLTKALFSTINYIDFNKGLEEEVNYTDYIDRIRISKFLSNSPIDDRKSFLIYQYEKILELGSGCKFGDIGMNSISLKRYNF